MPYSSASASIRVWYPLPWHAPSWETLVAGIPSLPPTLYMPAVLAIPLYSLNTLLLDAAASSSMPAPVWGGIITVAIAVVGWLLNRTISAFDSSVKKMEETITAISKEQTASTKLLEYMEKRIQTLEHKKEVLEKSFAEMDKLIAVQIDRKNNQHP
jgi:hypothetical protein